MPLNKESKPNQTKPNKTKQINYKQLILQKKTTSLLEKGSVIWIYQNILVSTWMVMENLDKYKVSKYLIDTDERKQKQKKRIPLFWPASSST